MFNKKLISNMIFTSLSLMACSLAEATITIENHTSSPSTSIVNQGACSSNIPYYGITEPGEINKIPDYYMTYYCGSSENCPADIYMSRNCETKTKIGTVYINAKTGAMRAVSSDETRYKIAVLDKTISFTQMF